MKFDSKIIKILYLPTVIQNKANDIYLTQKFMCINTAIVEFGFRVTQFCSKRFALLSQQKSTDIIRGIIQKP